MSHGFQFLLTFKAVSSWCKECAVLNRAIVRFDSTRGIHVLSFFQYLCFHVRRSLTTRVEGTLMDEDFKKLGKREALCKIGL
jgi:hypothetical protein